MSDEWRELAAPAGDTEPPIDLWTRVLQRETQLAPARPPHRLPRRGLAIALAAVACIAVIVLLALAAHSRSSAPAPAGPHIPILGPAADGWVAADVERPGGEISLVRAGEKARRLVVAGSAGATAVCPSWSPDGTRLLFGRVTGSPQSGSGAADLVIVPVGSDGATGDPKVVALDGFEPLDDNPCGMWSPDGRWIALAAPVGAAWVVDTQTGAIRRLPGLPATDLEWRPGTGELAIAGAEDRSTPVTIYSTATGKLNRLGDVEASNITWSPDGTTLAYTGGGADEPGLWLVDADGTNKRLLVGDLGQANHGIGPVWSPAGDRIAYQRLIPGRGEAHEVVLVNVADGTESTIAPPVTKNGSQQFRWYPYAVWWAPDGTTLLYAAWNEALPEETGPEWKGLIAVPADRPHHPTILIMNKSDMMPNGQSHQWPIQLWGRQPE